MIRPSAGTRSPASMLTMSPGTSSSIGIWRDLAVAPDLGLDDHHLLERGDARLGLALLVQAQERVEQGEEHEDHAGRELAGQEQADDAGHQQHDLHRVLVLAEERAASAAPSPPRRTCSSRTSPGGPRPRRRTGRSPRPRPGRRAPPPPSSRAMRARRPSSPLRMPPVRSCLTSIAHQTQWIGDGHHPTGMIAHAGVSTRNGCAWMKVRPRTAGSNQSLIDPPNDRVTAPARPSCGTPRRPDPPAQRARRTA